MKCYYSLDQGANWTEITGIIKFPEITKALDQTGYATIEIRDFEGALYATWEPRDFIDICVTDGTGTADIDNENKIFWGILINKIFTARNLTLICRGFGDFLDRKHFENNYIYYEGTIADATVAGQPQRMDLQYEDSDGNNQPFTWDDHEFCTGGKDHGILIVDATSGLNYRDDWDASAIAASGDDGAPSGDHTDTTDLDATHYKFAETTDTTTINMYADLTIDGTVIDSTTQYLKSIEVEYRIGCYFETSGSIGARIRLQIKKDTEWLSILDFWTGANPGSYTYKGQKWFSGLRVNDKGEEINAQLVAPDDTNTELAKYFNKTGDDYDELKGLRLLCTGSKSSSSNVFKCMIDYIKVRVGYHAQDISPVMKPIHDNGASWIDNDDVVWDDLGVADDDEFKIGTNVREVLDDISAKSGINIWRIDNFGSSRTETHQPNANGTNVQWDVTDGDHYSAVSDSNDATYVDTDVSNEIEEFAFPTWYLLQDRYVSQVVVRVRAKRNAAEEVTLAGYISWDDGATWSDAELTSTLTTSWANYDLTFEDLEIRTQDEIDKFEFKLVAPTMVGGGQVYVAEITATFTITEPDFQKYIARNYRGTYCLDALEEVKELEGAYWYEDYTQDSRTIRVLKRDDFPDSEVDLTSADYDFDWEFEDQCNQFSRVDVWGCSQSGIHAFAIDDSVTVENTKIIVNETIRTNADAQDIADATLAILNTKRPSIKLTLHGVYAALDVGKTVHITFERPTIDQALYPIRKIVRSKKGIDDIKTIIYAGLGETSPEENLAKIVRRNAYRSQRAKLDRLIAPGEFSVAMTQAEVEAIITAELVDGQSIDNRIDALILAHHDAGSDDHDNRYYTETEIDTWRTTAHNRVITPSNVWAEDDITAADANVSMEHQHIRFGKTSHTNDRSAFITFRLPDDYVDDSDFTYEFYFRINAGVANDVLDYCIITNRIYDGAAMDAAKDTDDSTQTEDCDAQQWHKCSITITGTDFNAGDLVEIDHQMEDDDNNKNVFARGFVLIVSCNTRD